MTKGKLLFKKLWLTAALSVVLVLSSVFMMGCGSSTGSNSSKPNNEQSSTQGKDDKDEAKENETSANDDASSNGSASSVAEETQDKEDAANSVNTSASADVPTYDKMNFTWDGTELRIPSHVSAWEEAGFTVSYTGDPETNYCSGRISSKKYTNFFIDVTVKVLNGPFGKEPCIVAAELPAMSILTRDYFATPEIPMITVADEDFVLGEVYALYSMGDVYGDNSTIYSYGTYDEKSAQLMMKYGVGGNGWERVNDMDPWDAWYTEYHYEKDGTSIWLVTTDRGYYDYGIDIDELVGFRISFDRFWE